MERKTTTMALKFGITLKSTNPISTTLSNPYTSEAYINSFGFVE
jgi:hypothetical protein